MPTDAVSRSRSAGRRSTSSVSGSSRVMPSPAAICRTTLPHAIDRMPGSQSIGFSSIGWPKPKMSRMTTGW